MAQKDRDDFSKQYGQEISGPWTPTAEGLASILAAHEEWLETKGTNGQRAELRFAQLQGVYLNYAKLKGADLIART